MTTNTGDKEKREPRWPCEVFRDCFDGAKDEKGQPKAVCTEDGYISEDAIFADEPLKGKRLGDCTPQERADFRIAFMREIELRGQCESDDTEQKLAKTTYKGEVFSHRQLWKAAGAMRDRAEAYESGSLYFNMTAMLLSRLTVEAYCNFVISVLDPATFEKEREEFRGGTDAKVQWVCEKAEFSLDHGARPYQTFKSLSKLRDRIVHAKPDVYEDEITHSADEESPFMQAGELERLVSPDQRARAFEDVESLCETIHEKVLSIANVEQKRRLESYALSGSLQRQTGSTSLVS